MTAGMFKLVFIIVFLVVTAIAVPNLVQVVGQRDNIVSADQAIAAGETYDCIMVLGASVLPDGTPSGILRDRLDVGIQLYKAGLAPKIVMSGDNQSDSTYDEVNNMKAYAVAHGVPSADVFCDHAGLCTYDSAYRAKYVFEAKRMIMVTQTYHLYRALYDANSLGVHTIGVASDLHTYALQLWYDTREVAARVSDFVKVHLKSTSTYLSEPVPLAQSGDVTSW